MSNIIQPPVMESSAPLHPNGAPFPGSPHRRRSSRRWVWIIVGIVALLCILGGTLLAVGVGFVVNNFGQSHATDMYYSAIKTQDYATAYASLGSDVKARLSQEAFTQTAQQNDRAEGRVSRFGFLNVPTGDPANVTLTVTRANGTSYTVHLELRQEAGAWKITAFDRI
jgi:hypothetical protein